MQARKEPLPRSDERVRDERRRAPLPTASREDLTGRKPQLLATTAPISVQEHQRQLPALPPRAGRDRPHRGDARYDQGARSNSVDNVDAAESGEVVRRRKRRRISPPTQAPPEYLNRRELLGLVPLCMSSIDTLEKAGIFPSRFVLSPTTRVAWKRKEVTRFLEQRAAKRVHTMHRVAGAAQDRTEPTNQGTL